MPDNELKLMEPAELMQAEYMDFLADFRATAEMEVHGAGAKPSDDFAGFVRRLRDNARNVDLPDGHVAASTYWLVLGGTEIVGTANLRHALTPHLAHEGGHIGYSVRPSRRRSGHGTRLLAMTLDKARALGLGEGLVTCDKGNTASAGVIGNNGGRLASEVVSRTGDNLVQRYWIEL